MPKKTILSAALATGVATGAQAEITTTPDSLDIIAIAEESLSGDVLITLDDDDDALITGVPQTETDEEVRIEYAQTYYGGSPREKISSGASRGNNITLDNGIKKPKGITLDNGIKKGASVKIDGPKRKKRGGGGRKKRR